MSSSQIHSPTDGLISTTLSTDLNSRSSSLGDSKLEQLADRIFATHVRPNGGVLLAAEEVLKIAVTYPVNLQWRDGDCHIRIGELGETKRPMPVSYFRALLARLSVLYSEASPAPADWNIYLDQGKLTRKLNESVERIIEMTFENTQQQQFASLRPVL